MGMSSGSKNTRGILSEINVTPLVDVMLVLLIMFMVTAPTDSEQSLHLTSSSHYRIMLFLQL